MGSAVRGGTLGTRKSRKGHETRERGAPCAGGRVPRHLPGEKRLPGRGVARQACVAVAAKKVQMGADEEGCQGGEEHEMNRRESRQRGGPDARPAGDQARQQRARQRGG